MDELTMRTDAHFDLFIPGRADAEDAADGSRDFAFQGEMLTCFLLIRRRRLLGLRVARRR